MKRRDVKIGKEYELIPLSEAKIIDSQYIQYGYSTNCFADFRSYRNYKKGDKVEVISQNNKWGFFRVRFSQGGSWWVMAEWLIDPDFKLKASSKPKSTIRLIRGSSSQKSLDNTP